MISWFRRVSHFPRFSSFPSFHVLNIFVMEFMNFIFSWISWCLSCSFCFLVQGFPGFHEFQESHTFPHFHVFTIPFQAFDEFSSVSWISWTSSCSWMYICYLRNFVDVTIFMNSMHVLILVFFLGFYEFTFSCISWTSSFFMNVIFSMNFINFLGVEGLQAARSIALGPRSSVVPPTAALCAADFGWIRPNLGRGRPMQACRCRSLVSFPGDSWTWCQAPCCPLPPSGGGDVRVAVRRSVDVPAILLADLRRIPSRQSASADELCQSVRLSYPLTPPNNAFMHFYIFMNFMNFIFLHQFHEFLRVLKHKSINASKFMKFMKI